jgi:hypothetical protein
LLFGRTHRARAGEAEERESKEDCDGLVTEHGGGIYVNYFRK